MTFRVTCVVLRMVFTHFVNVASGIDSEESRRTVVLFVRNLPAALRTSIGSNQKKQVN